MSDARRIQLQPAYVLHHRPYRDTSRILELFTRDHGRVSVFARGARGGVKSGASLLPLLQPFNRLLVSWSGRGEAGQLTGAEFDGAMTPLPPDRLVHGFYLNELLLKLFARHDSHPDVFALYSQTMDRLKVEDAIRHHPDVEDCAVIGMPHGRTGEEVVAAVVLRQGASLDAESIRSMARERLTPYKVPRRVVQVDDLPRSLIGKVIRRQVKEQLVAGESGSETSPE